MRDYALKFKPITEEPEKGVVLLFFLFGGSDIIRGDYNLQYEDTPFRSYGGMCYKKERVICWAYAPLYDEVVE